MGEEVAPISHPYIGEEMCGGFSSSSGTTHDR